ncbi:MAG: T9SS type A sorting domain-containing protein, partial [Caldithrix sp.]|nr:T9SS type A sorting domain-containing protein [Caldithrix sp.]
FNHIINNQPVIRPQKFNNTQIINLERNDVMLITMTNSADNNISNISYDLKEKPPFPATSPVKVTSRDNTVRFFNVPPAGTINIFNLNGRPVTELHAGMGNQGIVDWSLSSSIATGIYLYIIKADGNSFSGKIAIVR